jgi:hypothetical protein
VVWFKVDDGFYSSTKVLSIPRASRLPAVGLWTMAGNWSGRELSDGIVPAYVLAELGATPNLRQALVKARLWLDRGEGGIEFHDWAKYQPSREKVLAEREKAAERQAKARASRRDSGSDNGVTSGELHPESHSESHDPDPTRPDPTYIPTAKAVGKPRKRGTRIPEPFVVTGEMRAWAATKTPGIDVDRTTVKFVNYWRAKTSQATKLDWRATWDNWLLSDYEKLPSKSSRTDDNLDTVAYFASQSKELER